MSEVQCRVLFKGDVAKPRIRREPTAPTESEAPRSNFQDPFFEDQFVGIERFLTEESRLRDLALFNVAIDTMLRPCDFLPLRVKDIRYSNGDYRSVFSVRQKKTKRALRATLTDRAIEAVHAWLSSRDDLRPNSLLFPGRSGTAPLCLRQVERLVKQWASAIGLPEENYSARSLRKTKASFIYRRTLDLEIVRILLGHASLAATARYLGIKQQEALEVALSMDMADSTDEIESFIHRIQAETCRLDNRYRDDSRLRLLYDFLFENDWRHARA